MMRAPGVEIPPGPTNPATQDRVNRIGTGHGAGLLQQQCDENGDEAHAGMIRGGASAGRQLAGLASKARRTNLQAARKW